MSFPQSRGHLKPKWAAVEPAEAARPDVAFFLRRNPGYVARRRAGLPDRASSANLRPLARRVFEQGAPREGLGRHPRRRTDRNASCSIGLRDATRPRRCALLRQDSRRQCRNRVRPRPMASIRSRSIDEFRARVPIRSYESFAHGSIAWRPAKLGVLTREPVIAFEETGGSTSGRKLIPYTAASLAAFRAAVLPWLADLADRRPGAFRAARPMWRSARSRARSRRVGGIPVGLASEGAYLGADLVPAFVSVLAVPPSCRGPRRRRAVALRNARPSAGVRRPDLRLGLEPDLPDRSARCDSDARRAAGEGDARRRRVRDCGRRDPSARATGDRRGVRNEDPVDTRSGFGRGSTP